MTGKRFRISQGYSDKFCHDWEKNKLLNFRQTVDLLNALHEENKRLQSDLAKVIEQARKNDNLLRSDIRILEKALWCSGCENNFKRLKELRKEFIR